MRKNYPRWLLTVVVFLVLFANVFNIGADVAAMGAALQLIVGGPSLLYSFLFGLVSTLLIVWIPYTSYVSYLKWLTLVLLAYILTAFVVHVPWGEALRSTVIPTVAFNLNSLTALTAVLGTTISPYLFFLAVIPGERKRVRVRIPGTCVEAGSRASPKTTPPDQVGYVFRHGGFQYCIILHHHGHSRDFEYERYPQYRHCRAGGGSATPDRGAVCFLASRDHWDRPSFSSRACRIGGLCSK